MISRRKTILTIILSVFLVVAFMVVTLAANRLIFADKVRTRDAKKLESINRMLEDLSSSLSDAERNAAEQYEVNATLTATALRHVIRQCKQGSGAYRFPLRRGKGRLSVARQPFYARCIQQDRRISLLLSGMV